MVDDEVVRDDENEDFPVLGVYGINVTFRGTAGAKAPTLGEVEEAIENVLVDLGGPGAVAVRVKATRTDR